jgi:hypothetical protein
LGTFRLFVAHRYRSNQDRAGRDDLHKPTDHFLRWRQFSHAFLRLALPAKTITQNKQAVCARGISGADHRLYDITLAGVRMLGVSLTMDTFITASLRLIVRAGASDLVS